MQKSQIDNFMWLSHINGNANSRNPWPELCQNEVKHSSGKKDFINITDDNGAASLDHSEYPELGSALVKSKNFVVPRDHCLSRPNSGQIVLPMQTSLESKRSKSFKRYKKSDKICINLQEALQNTIRASKIGKEFPGIKINLYMNSLELAIPTTLGKNAQKCSDRKKINMCISEIRKCSKLKKLILLHRNMKAQINIDKREAFERKKMEAIYRDVDAMNFDALKITANPETNMDYVRNMWAMTLYDKDHRNVNEISISDNTLSHRPDVIGKINNLGIQGRPLTNRLVVRNNRTNFSDLVSNIVENDIVKQTLSLHIAEDLKEEGQNSTDIDDKSLINFSRNFREYCTNMLTVALNNNLEKFIQEITRLQKRFHEKNPNKSKYKRRYYSGLKEVRKHVELKKLKFVIIAPDIEKVELEDGLDDQIDKVLNACKKEHVVYCFGLRRRKLGYYTHGKGFVGCVGIANYSGIELLFKNVLTELVDARNAFKKLNGDTESIIDISKVISEDYLLSENINALLKILSYNMHS